jgi:predicted transcriptional regulator
VSLAEKGRVSHYEELWTRLNAVNALIEDLEKERTDIKAKQRQLANAMVVERAQAIREGKAE